MDFEIPKLDESRQFATVLDEQAINEPDRIIFSTTRTNNPADGFRDFTVRQVARAVDRCAWFLQETLGSPQSKTTIAYMGPQDLVYMILILACTKTGHALFLSSPRNSLEAHLRLFGEVNSQIFLQPPSFPLAVVKQILAARPMRVVEVAPLAKWFEDQYDGRDEHYPYTKAYEDAKSDPLVVLHTSGSTGFPKPIVTRQATWTHALHVMKLAQKEGTQMFGCYAKGSRIYVSMPFFHAAGIGFGLATSIYGGCVAVFGPYPPSPDIVHSIFVHGNVDVCIVAPTILVELARMPEHLEQIRKLKSIIFGGGPLPRAVGDILSKTTNIVNAIGSTEAGMFPQTSHGGEDWEYVHFHPVGGHDFRPVSDDLYEHFIVKRPELMPFQGAFGTFPELDEWAMKDLYSKHPTKEGLWLHRGRSDDVIVFATGEKLNPIDMEGIIQADPAVTAAIVTGRKRFQSSLLVEPTIHPTTEAEKEELLDKIWPSVEEANKHSPKHGRILRNMVLFSTPDKPAPRAGKGTVQRRHWEEDYSSELDALHEANDNRSSSSMLDGDANGSIEDIIRQIIAATSDLDVKEVASDTDLFSLGLDSLQVTSVTKRINQLLSGRGSGKSVDIRAVYSNPTIGALANLVASLVGGIVSGDAAESDEQKMQRLYKLHTADLPLSARPAESRPADDLVALLIGSTGSLGAYILDALLKDSRISRVYCLNRGPDSRQRMEKSFSDKGLQELPERVVCLDGDFSKPRFALPAGEYTSILSEVTTVIENAWQVDFHRSIDSFADQVHGIRRLVDFSSHSRFGAQLFFVSSIGAVMNCMSSSEHENHRVPESIFEDWQVPQGMGYAQSKSVSERILHVAAREAGIPTSVCRVGQIAGPQTEAGVWPKQEWLPSLIASSKYLGKLPQTLGAMDVVDWVPVDVLGQSIVELATLPIADTSHGAVVYHLVNPHQTTWSELAPTVAQNLDPSGEKLETVSIEQWVEALRNSASGTEDLAVNPAAKLLHFFQGLIRSSPMLGCLDVAHAVAKSPSLSAAKPIQNESMQMWLRQWNF